MARLPCPVGSRIQIEKEKLNRASAMPNERSRENALRAWRRRKPIWIVGRQAVPIPAFMAPRKALLLKTIAVQQKEQRSNFDKVPDDLTLTAAAAILTGYATLAAK